MECPDLRRAHFLGIKHRARDLEFRGPEPGHWIGGYRHNAHRDALGHACVDTWRDPFRPDVGLPPALQAISPPESCGTWIGLAIGVLAHDDLYPSLVEVIQGEPAAEAAVCDDGVAAPEMLPELAAEVALAAAKRSGRRADPYPGGKIK